MTSGFQYDDFILSATLSTILFNGVLNGVLELKTRFNLSDNQKGLVLVCFIQ